ncbi:MAG TPA: SRPBCC domain-containing protein [Bacteroidota bacterium]|nr:SRPBCC domain-containing protein [Bacteroidota bacterium]
MADILHRVGIHAPAETVYDALTLRKGLAGWWTRDTLAAPAVGAINRFGFGPRGFNLMKVTEMSPPQRVRWLCIDGVSEWIGTEVAFDLRRESSGSIVLFAERRWKEPVEYMHYCSTKWATYLLSLKLPCETGKGTPYPEDVGID